MLQWHDDKALMDDKALIDEILDVLFDAIKQVHADTGIWFYFNEGYLEAEEAIRVQRMWMEYAVLNRFKINRREKYPSLMRFLCALKKGLEDKTLNCEDDSDVIVSSFQNLLWSNPQLVEYYLERGEFVDVVGMARRTDTMRENEPFATGLLELVMYRLYTFDVMRDAKIRLDLNAGEKTQCLQDNGEFDELYDFPLDIRAELCDFNKPFSVDERPGRKGFLLDHTLPETVDEQMKKTLF